MASRNTFSVPPDLMVTIEAAAREANKTPGQWAIETMERQLEDNRWQNMLKRNERNAQALGIREEDVPDAVHQDGLERAR